MYISKYTAGIFVCNDDSLGLNFLYVALDIDIGECANVSSCRFWYAYNCKYNKINT